MSTTAEQEVQTVAEPAATGLVVQSERQLSAFESRSGFDAAVPIAKALASSTVVPETYRNNTANCLVAMELAHRTRASVLMVMQNLHIIKGKPSWSSAFLVSSVNTCGRFSPVRYEIVGETGKAGWKCRAVVRELSTHEVLSGTWITWEMAVGENWVSRPDSKWKTMPEQMIRYRAAAFWVRTFAPELALGMHTADELEDANLTAARTPSVGVRDLNAALRATPTADASAVVVDDATPETDPTGPDAAADADVIVEPETEQDIRREEQELLRWEEGR